MEKIVSKGENVAAPSLRVDGTTRVVVLLAYPATHVRTPAFFNALAAARELNAVLVPWQVAPSELPAALNGLRSVENLAGVIVTVPHKINAAELFDELEGIAGVLRVANVARRTFDGRFIGRMYDGLGFVNGMQSHGITLRGQSVLLLGAGGAGTAVADALLGAHVGNLAIHNRDAAKAKALVAKLKELHAGAPIEVADGTQGTWDIVINSTSLGLHPDDPLPIDPKHINSRMVVADVIMQPDETALLKAAKQIGCRTHKGVHMVTSQVEYLMDFLLSEG
ncbi:shikimate dehydrogenase family protein [Herbaspirillum sp. GCM10030257]|uniref:shikimate dehydrogenase family protein n=1 Tax=Herbaspirillum sp. GCM10030257 TaxID=3273393 RepID=UPI00361E7F92